MRLQARHTPDRRNDRGFTLLELLIVMVIIGILLAFILNAAFDGVRRAEERQTQATIYKLENGLADRIDAIAATRINANMAHVFMSGVYSSSLPSVFNTTTGSPHFGFPTIFSMQRAQVLARIDQLRAEIPDVFTVQGSPGGLSNSMNFYPLNFGAAAYSGTPVMSGDAGIHGPFLLPMGIGIANVPPGSLGASALGSLPETTGAYGASYTAASGLYKSLVTYAVNHGATPPSPMNRGYDGIDNDGDGLVDELDESGSSVASAIVTLLANHTHKTARSEVLYALLVEGQGPFGSIFSADDFSDREVKDTDGDGLPEFVDAWGEPLQFFHWPISFVSDAQKGMAKYSGAFETRQQNSIDPNQQLVDPAWYSSSVNDTDVGPFVHNGILSGPASLFQMSFFSLTDPFADPAHSPTAGTVWDRGLPGTSSFPRREFYSRHLILSGGPDKTPGVPVLDPDYYTSLSYYATIPSGAPAIGRGGNAPGGGYSAASLIHLRYESQAAQATPLRNNAIYMSLPSGSDPLTPGIHDAGSDDITSQGLLAPGGAVQ